MNGNAIPAAVDHRRTRFQDQKSGSSRPRESFGPVGVQSHFSLSIRTKWHGHGTALESAVRAVARSLGISVTLLISSGQPRGRGMAAVLLG